MDRTPQQGADDLNALLASAVNIVEGTIATAVNPGSSVTFRYVNPISGESLTATGIALTPCPPARVTAIRTAAGEWFVLGSNVARQVRETVLTDRHARSLSSEIPFKFVLAGIRAESQPYTFKVGSKTKEISYANRDRVDIFGRGEIDATGRTSNRKLKLTFEATIDGNDNKETDVFCVFYVAQPTKLQATITCSSTLTAAGSDNRITGALLTPTDLCNWLILNQIKLPDLSYGSSLDATNFVPVTGSLPATSEGFITRNPGRYTGDKITGVLPKATIDSGNNGGFMIVFAPDGLRDQRSRYTYKTIFTFAFR